MRTKIFEVLMILTGSFTFLISLLLDLFYSGHPGIGFEQLAGMVIGSIIILIGVRRIFLPDMRKWDWLLFSIYLCGILFAGLRPSGAIDIYQSHLFGMNSLSKRDLVVNIAGFIPLGFLSMAALTYKHGHKESFLYIILAVSLGIFISLIIETLQFYWVPGRYSSTYDLLCNASGTTIGVMSYIFIGRYSFVSSK